MKRIFRVAAGAFAATLVATIAATFATQASAQSTPPPPAPSTTPAPAPAPEPAPELTGSRAALSSMWGFITGGRPYLGLGAGAANTSGFNGTVLGVDISGDAFKASGKGMVGYQFNPYVGLEAQYSSLGSRNISGAFGSNTGMGSTTAQQWGIAGTAGLPVSDNLGLMMKLGASHNHMGSTEFCVSAYCSAFTSSHTDIMWGLGVVYTVNKHFSIRAEYEDFGRFSTTAGINGGTVQTGGANPGDIRAENYSLDLIWTF
jgi:Outer membrane protein beta-barrel domain